MRSVRAAIATPRWMGALLGTIVLAGALTGTISLKGRKSGPRKEVADAKLAMSRMPLIFEANRGQSADQVKFLSRGAGYNFYITPTASYLALARLPESAKHGQRNQRLPKNAPVSRLKMSLVGANPKAKVRHEGDQLGRSNYFIGNKPENWVTDVPSFGRILCEDVWKGIDVAYYGNQQELEHDFILAPGTRVDQVKLEYAGQKAIRVDKSGDLILDTGIGEVRQAAPVAYQLEEGKRQPVKAEYQLLADNRVGFKVGSYDISRELVIDPVIRYSTYIGGSMDDYAYDIQVDSTSRSAYITGYTGSFIQDSDTEPNLNNSSLALSDYPTVNPFSGDPDRRNSASQNDLDAMQNPNTDRTQFDESGYDAFVTRFNANGTGLIYSTYLGAEADDYGMALATSAGRVSDDPYIYVTGATNSTFWPLQIAVQTRQAGRDAFAVKLDPSRSGAQQLVFSTYLGGNGSDTGRAIAVDNTANVHIAGITSSDNLPVFSTTGVPYQSSRAGSNDIFLVSLDASGSAFNYYTYFGGTGDENGLPVAAGLNFNYTVPRAPWVSPGSLGGNAGRANAQAYGNDINVAIAVDTQGNTFVAGGTTSTDLFNNFPATGTVQTAHASPGLMDGYVAKFNPSGQPVWGTYHGGTGDDACRSVAINPQGQVYVTGYTASSDNSFPTVQPGAAITPAYYNTYRGGASDAFISKFNSTATIRLFSSYLGGSGTDIGYDIAVSPTGQAYLCGTTTSPFPSFPLVNPAQNGIRGGVDAFITKYTADGAEFEYSTYFGGGSAINFAPADEIAAAIAIDSLGQAYVGGSTGSTDMPTSFFTYQNGQRGPFGNFPTPQYEGFLAVSDAFVIQPHSPPFAPSNLIPTAIGRNGMSQHFVSMAWTDNSDNESGFEVERKLGDQASSAPFQVVQVINTPNAVTHTDVPLVATTTYTYRVRPFNQAVVAGSNTTFYGPYSNQMTVTTLPEPPSAPTNLVITPIDTQRLKLDWTDTSNNEASFKIERRKVTPPSTSFTEITVILSDSTTSPGTGGRTFTDDNGGAGLLANTTYEYRIRSSNVAGDSVYLGPVAGKTLPNAPTIAPVLSVAGQTNSRIDLSWTYDNNDQLGFRVYRAPETSPGSNMPATFVLIRSDTQTTAKTVPPFDDVYTFSDPGLASNTKFFYQVRSYNQSGDGPLSNQVSGTTLPDPPQDASNLDVTLIAGTNADIRLTWTDNSEAPAEESGFKIERSPDGTGSWTQVAIVGQHVGLGTVSTDLTNQTRNTVHFFRVIAYTANPSGDSDALPSNVDCAMTLPMDASDLAATPNTQTQITLTWTDNNPGGTQSNFRIEQSLDGSSGWTTVGTTGLSPAGGTKTFPVTGLTQNTQYFFRVRTFNTAPPGCDGGGDSPAYTGVVGAFTLPGATTSVTVTNIPPTTNLRITFTDANQPGSTSQHLIERAETAGGPWTTVTDLPAGVTTFDDTDNGGNLDGNFTFFYRVTAHNSSGSAAPSTPVGRLTLPAAATNLTVTVPTDTLNGQRRGRTQLDLTWTDNSRVPTSFDVERSLDGMTWVQIGTAAVGAGTYTDTGLTENTTYCYRVFGRNASGRGDISSPLPPVTCATTLKVPPTGPTGLTATVVSSTQIDLTWTDTANNEEYYRIDRKIGVNGAYSTLVPMLPADSQSYQDMGLQPDTTYTYIVYAVNNGGDSLPSREAGGTTLKVAPAAPTNLVVSAVSATAINVQWDDNATSETGFELERTPSGGSPTIIQVAANTAANPVSYTDTGLSPNTSYSYRVRAKNNNFSAWLGPQSALTHPASPSGLSASAQSPTRIRLQWTDNNGANPSGNRILRRAAGDPMFVILTDRNAASGTTYDDDTVESGKTYTYVVFAINADQVLSAQSTNEASATTPATPPAAPTDLVATATSSSSILLTWTDRANNETIFKIERASGSSSFRQIATRGSSAGVDGTVTFTDQGLVAGTLYVYRVRASNGGGDSGYTNEDDATTLPIPPGAPSALTATALSTTSIRLDWTDGSSNEDEFRIQRKNSTSGVFEDYDTVPANTTTYTDGGLTADTLYEYRVYAHNGGGNSGFSNQASARTHPNPPTAPSNFVATAQSQSSIRLTWQDNSTNETSFRLSRSTDGSTFTTLVVVGANVTNYTDQGLSTNTQYFYRLVATNLGGDSTAVDANAFTHPNPPTAPTGLQAQALSQTSIRLTWTDAASTETGFRIERRTASSQFAAVGTAAQNATMFVDTNGLVADTAYTYRIAAVNDGGNSTFSNDATATTLPNPPVAPSNLTVSVPAGGVSASAVGSTQLTLNWVDQSDNETGFKIERRTAITGFAQVGMVGANVTTFTDQNLSPQTLYFYQVKATNAGGDSAASNEASGTTLPNPPSVAPNNLTATAISSTQIRLNWTEAIPDETGFKIERGTTSANLVAVGTAGQNATEFLDSGLTPNTTYFYQVRATNSGGDSAASNVANATTRPNPPVQVTGLTVTPLPAPDGRNVLSLSWTDTATETSYRVERKGANNQFAMVGTTGQNENTFLDTGLTPATTYTYRVVAINSGGEGTASGEATGTTLPNPPAAPSNVVVIGADATTLRVKWQDNSNNEDGFRIYRQVNGDFVLANTAGANDTETKISGLASGVVQTFRVTAFNAGGESDPSDAVSAVTPNSGRLKVSRTALNFGTVAQGSSNTRSFRLTNIGTGPLQVGYVAPPAPYSIDAPASASLMLQPRQFVDVIVRFTPTARGRATRTLIITSSDARKPQANIRLVGVGGAVRK